MSTETHVHNDFAVALYAQLCTQPGNLFFSPFSIWTALGMMLAGARGDTAEEMQRVLRLDAAGVAPNATVGELARPAGVPGSAGYEIALANSLWSQKDAPLEAEFLNTVVRDYKGAVHAADFRGAPEPVRAEVNAWVANETRNRIRELLHPGTVTNRTRLVLVNAIYFKGWWLLPFHAKLTRDGMFHLEGGKDVRTPMMFHMGSESVPYFETETFQAVDLLYCGHDLSMLVLLPRKHDGLRDLEGELSASELHEWTPRLRAVPVFLSLPRFRIEWGTAALKTALSALGMPSAFDHISADLSGMNGRRPPDKEALVLDDVYHKAFVEVDEKGTEAAAATAGVEMVLGVGTEPEPKRFLADHPFLFAIRERTSGVILFLGRVMDPTQQNGR